MNQGSHTVEQGMHRTWQHFPKCLTAHLLDRYSIDIRLLFDLKSNNNRRTIEQQTKNRACNPMSNTCQMLVNNDSTVWLRRTNIYDARGVLMDTKTLNPDAEWIDINVSAYRPGIYIYEYKGVSNKFVVR